MKAHERLKQQLEEAFRQMHGQLSRAEVLAAALAAFSKPVPDYEPEFRHYVPFGRSLNRFEINA